MISPEPVPFSKARDYAFLLLKFRLRSEQELYERLKRKKFAEPVIKETLSFLKERGFLDDNLFAKNWIESRLKKPLSIRKIRQELKLKGVAREIIDNQISSIGRDYSEEDIVRGIIRRKLARMKGIEPQIARRRLYAYLVRRGFSAEAVVEAISDSK